MPVAKRRSSVSFSDLESAFRAEALLVGRVVNPKRFKKKKSGYGLKLG